jgi:hypothetical protein
MSTKWSAEVLNNGAVDFDDLFKDQFAILLLRGKNVFGDFIYCYLKASIKQIKELNTVLKGDKEFAITDYGTVVAAGKGNPPDDIKAEIALAFPGAVDTPGKLHQGINAPPEVLEKKGWDEY